MSYKNKVIYLVFLLTNIVFYLINLLWAKDNFLFLHSQVGWDCFTGIVKALEGLRDGLGILNIAYGLYGHGPGSAIYFLYQALIGLLFSFVDDISVVLGNCILFTLTSICVYKIGKLIKNEFTGLAAVALLSVYPGIYGIVRTTMSGNIAIPLVALTILMLLRVEHFQSFLKSMLLGFVLGLGAWAKHFFIYFVGGSLIYELNSWQIAFRKGYLGSRRAKTLINVFLVIFLILLVGLPFYILNFVPVRQGFYGHNMFTDKHL